MRYKKEKERKKKEMNKGVEGLMTGSMRQSVLIKQWNSSPLLKKTDFHTVYEKD